MNHLRQIRPREHPEVSEQGMSSLKQAKCELCLPVSRSSHCSSRLRLQSAWQPGRDSSINRPPCRRFVPGLPAETGCASGDRRGLDRSVPAAASTKPSRSIADVDGGRLQADDLLALGTALLERDRIVLGWAALEAAHRIDPGNATCSQALDKLQAKLALAQGRERLLLHEAASRVELLGAVPGGPPLGMLALGLAGSANDLAQEQELLDRLVIRDRSALRRVGSLDDAVKLVARLLLEVGQPVKARELLEPLASPAGSSTPAVRA